MKQHIHSTLEKIIQDAWQYTDLEAGKKFVIEYLETTRIDEVDKKKMIF